MTAMTQPAGDLNWLLDDLVGRVAALRHAVILSSDGLATGLRRGWSGRMPSTWPPSRPASTAWPRARAGTSMSAGCGRP